MYKFYLVYKITNTKTNRIYIGAHRTNDIDDGYMGSGEIVKKAIKKHGKDVFKKEILYYCESEEEMFQKELEIVNEEFVSSAETYNACVGGKGGSPEYLRSISGFVNKDKLSEDSFEKMKAGWRLGGKIASKKNIENGVYKKEWMEEGLRLCNSLESLKKKKETFKEIGHQQGEKNSQFGKCYVFSEEKEESIKIKKEYLDEYLEVGYKKGRKMCFE